jgi:HSP20 family molecular chaperone IbpA
MHRILEDWERPSADKAMRGAPPLDRKLTSARLGARMTIPGVKSDDTKTTVTGNVPSTRDEIRLEKEKVSARHHGLVRCRTFFGRSVALPGPVVAANTEARLRYGRLP